MVGGITLFFMAKAMTAASIPPAAPSKCPVMDLVELMATLVFSPNTVFIAMVSKRSLRSVEVPWALI